MAQRMETSSYFVRRQIDNEEDSAETKGRKKYCILLLNGPNVNLTGLRNQAQYGTETLVSIIARLRAAAHTLDCELDAHQSNSESDLITWIHEAIIPIPPTFRGADGIILNAGGLTHTSVSLRDAVEAAHDLGVPTIEVHLSDPDIRESFRRVNYLRDVCAMTFKGEQGQGYMKALCWLAEHLRRKACVNEAFTPD